MASEVEREDTRKAMAYDLIQILEANPAKDSYTAEEMKTIIHICLTEQSRSNTRPVQEGYHVG